MFFQDQNRGKKLMCDLQNLIHILWTFFIGLRGGTVESYDMIARSDEDFDVFYMDINM